VSAKVPGWNGAIGRRNDRFVPLCSHFGSQSLVARRPRTKGCSRCSRFSPLCINEVSQSYKHNQLGTGEQWDQEVKSGLYSGRY
jgi:hypothetical protein